MEISASIPHRILASILELEEGADGKADLIEAVNVGDEVLEITEP